MGNTFPETMNKLEYQDTEKSLKKIEDYIHYMCERIDFSISNISKTAANLGSSKLSEYEVLEQMKSNIATLSSGVSNIDGKVKSQGTSIQTLQGDIRKINETLTTLTTTVNTISSTILTMSQTIETIQNDITSIDNRVKALEGV